MSRQTWIKAVLKSAKEDTPPKAPWARGERRDAMIERRKESERKSA